MSLWKSKKPTEKSSPIKHAALPEPAASLIAKRFDFFGEKFVIPTVTALIVWILAGYEWYCWLFDLPRIPVVLTFGAAAVSVFVFVGMRKNFAEIRRLNLGIEGEQAVGQQLERDLIPLGYNVFHDICFDDFNIDHAAIGPHGVFAFETKTASKPKGDARVSFDGKQIVVAGFKPDRDPVNQAKANANQLREKLREYTGQEHQVRPVVIYPGWFVDLLAKNTDLWVLNEKLVVAFLNREPQRLSEEQISVLSSGLTRYVRDQSK